MKELFKPEQADQSLIYIFDLIYVRALLDNLEDAHSYFFYSNYWITTRVIDCLRKRYECNEKGRNIAANYPKNRLQSILIFIQT